MQVESGPADREAYLSEMEAEGLHVIEWTDAPGVHYPEHSHPDREVRVVLDGSMTVRTGTTSIELHPGDRVVFEAGERHEVWVGSEGVTYLAGSTRHP